MIPLITYVEISRFKTISQNVNAAKKIEPYVLEAQEFDLKGLLGPALYLDLINDFESSPSLLIYSDLFNGCEFEYKGKQIRHEGIISVLSYLAYSRSVLNGNFESTAFGMVVKSNEYSTQPTERAIQRMSDQAKSGAMAYWGFVEKFLNQSDFELWNKKNKKVTSNRISGV